jgi:uncharacterized RDD family membrane protein YckC
VIYAGFWSRAVAILVDLAVWAPLLVLYFAAQGLSIPVAIVAQVAMTILGFAYPVYFLSRWGQTIGKMVAGIKVTLQDGAPVRSRHAWLRSSVDIGLAAIYLIATIYVLATWAGPDWSSLNWLDRGGELAKRSPVFTLYDWVSQAWMWSELVVLLLNKKRRALHDFIAGTVVVKVRPRPSIASIVPAT